MSPVFGQIEKASLEGLVLDGATRQPIVGAKVEAFSMAGKVASSKTTVQDGSFRLSLSAKELYQIIVQAKGYVNSVEQIDFSDPRVVSRVGKTVYLTKSIPTNSTPATASIPPPARPTTEAPAVPTRPRATSATASRPSPPKPVTAASPVGTPPAPALTASVLPAEIESIFFTQSTAEVLPESRGAMDKLVQFLNQNPTLTVELAGHTDNQGDFDQNVLLSRQRAETVKTYVLSKGIAASRIRTRGYGGTRPAKTNNYEETRPMNRRVEVTIVGEK
ncbi:OmpA family protein [Fibrella aestuarina]|uniref:OmpA family protein n=1 Tax=Fibrella aestuarina TaxID=651143 RepID=UPI0002F92774|nr:OmpA family protein [Fibrella aestuarina]